MVVHGNELNVVIIKEVVPLVIVVSERVVEHEVRLRRVGLHHLSYLSVKVFQNNEISVPPWLIDWLKSLESTVASPSLE
jgi:hypothetical protein